MAPARLAVDGGAPVRTTPMPRWPAPGREEIEAVTEVLRSGRLNYWTGTEGRSLEGEYAALLGRAHGVAVANGTLALELALRAFGVGPGDEVIVPARTFIATASAAVAVGATPVVADIDAESGGLTGASVRAVLTPRTRAVIPVHLAGWPVDMDPLLSLAREHGLIVIEDCAQAHGASYRGRPAGALGSHAAAFSFCHEKVVPAGEGGLLVLDDEEAYRRAWAYKDHGKSLEKAECAEEASDGLSFVWMADTFGSNWRMEEMAAALARAGLAKLPAWHEARERNARLLADGLEGAEGIRVPLPAADTVHAFYRLQAYVRPETLSPGWDRDRIVAAIAAEGVPCQYGCCAEIYREAAFTCAGLGPAERLPVASRVHETALAFFVHPTLEAEDIADTVEAARKVLEAATR